VTPKINYLGATILIASRLRRQMTRARPLLAFAIAALVAIKVAAIGYAVFAQQNWIDNGGTLDQAKPEWRRNRNAGCAERRWPRFRIRLRSGCGRISHS
jgi:hypothetical protein